MRDQVWLNSKNIRTQRLFKKLDDKWIGHFTITELVGVSVDLSFQQLFGYIQFSMSPYYALQLKTQFLAKVISAQALLLALI